MRIWAVVLALMGLTFAAAPVAADETYFIYAGKHIFRAYYPDRHESARIVIDRRFQERLRDAEENLQRDLRDPDVDEVDAYRWYHEAIDKAEDYRYEALRDLYGSPYDEEYDRFQVYFMERPYWQSWYFSYDFGAVRLGVRFHDRDRRYFALPDRFRYGFERDRYYTRHRPDRDRYDNRPQPRPRPNGDRYDYYRNLDRNRRDREPVDCEPNRRPTLPPATTRTRDTTRNSDPVRWDPRTYDRSSSDTRYRDTGPRDDARTRDNGPRDTGTRTRDISPRTEPRQGDTRTETRTRDINPRDSGTRTRDTGRTETRTRDSGTRNEPNRNSGWRSTNSNPPKDRGRR